MERQSSYTSVPEQKLVYLQERKSLILAGSDNIEHVFIYSRNKIDIDVSMNQINVSQDSVDGESYKTQKWIFGYSNDSMKHIYFIETRKMITLH